MVKRKRAAKKKTTKKAGVPKTMQKNIAAIKRSIESMKKKLSKV